MVLSGSSFICKHKKMVDSDIHKRENKIALSLGYFESISEHNGYQEFVRESVD